MYEHLTVSRLANLAAKTMFEAFDIYHQQFKQLTKRMQRRFEHGDWQGMHAVSAERIDLYPAAVQPLVAELRTMLEQRIHDEFVWASMKAVYSGLIAERDDWELAETFFNSVTRRIFTTVGVNPLLEFLDPDYAEPIKPAQEPVYRAYSRADSLPHLIETILNDYAFAVPYHDLHGDAKIVAERLQKYLQYSSHPDYDQIEMVKAVLYRNKGAYLIGRVLCGPVIRPMVLALRSTAEGIVIDAALFEERATSMLFSFTRSHFHVDVDRPYDLVQFISSMLPSKRIAELYSALGYHKHGKTTLYRDLLHHLAQSDDQFVIAPGERGMVMIVWTLPSYDVVFKVIKDVFASPKDTTHEKVREKYRLVFRHDRAGRLVEAHEFEYLTLDRKRFAPALLEELCRVAQKRISIEGEHVVIKHVYIERRITPLDIYLREVPVERACAAVLEWGNAIKDLARTNIFPGDMLLKNFGVTRNGRVIFYDYDEISLLEECRFKRMPEPQSYDEEMASEPWYSVGPNDVFPEEFGRFLGLRKPLREVFEKHHDDLLDIHFWQAMQRRIKAGELCEIIPYAERHRLHGQD